MAMPQRLQDFSITAAATVTDLRTAGTAQGLWQLLTVHVDMEYRRNNNVMTPTRPLDVIVPSSGPPADLQSLVEVLDTFQLKPACVFTLCNIQLHWHGQRGLPSGGGRQHLWQGVLSSLTRSDRTDDKHAPPHVQPRAAPTAQSMGRRSTWWRCRPTHACGRRAARHAPASAHTPQHATFLQHIAVHGARFGWIDVTKAQCQWVDDGEQCIRQCKYAEAAGGRAMYRARQGCAGRGQHVRVSGVRQGLHLQPGRRPLRRARQAAGLRCTMLRVRIPTATPSFGQGVGRPATHCATHGFTAPSSAHTLFGQDPSFCAQHGRSLGYVDLYKPTCTVARCGTKPTYGFAWCRPTHCATHGRDRRDVVHLKFLFMHCSGHVHPPSHVAVHCEAHAKRGGRAPPRHVRPRRLLGGVWHTWRAPHPLHRAQDGHHGRLAPLHPPCAVGGCERGARYGPAGGEVAHCLGHRGRSDSTSSLKNQHLLLNNLVPPEIRGTLHRLPGVSISRCSLDTHPITKSPGI